MTVIDLLNGESGNGCISFPVGNYLGVLSSISFDFYEKRPDSDFLYSYIKTTKNFLVDNTSNKFRLLP